MAIKIRPDAFTDEGTNVTSSSGSWYDTNPASKCTGSASGNTETCIARVKWASLTVRNSAVQVRYSLTNNSGTANNARVDYSINDGGAYVTIDSIASGTITDKTCSPVVLPQGFDLTNLRVRLVALGSGVAITQSFEGFDVWVEELAFGGGAFFV